MRSKTPEGYVQSAILDLLAVERIWAVRLNSRTVMLPGRGGRQRPVYFGLPGMADILATPFVPGPPETDALAKLAHWRPSAPLPLWIECKAPGARQSEEQKNFERSVTEAGHFYLVADSVDVVLAWLREHR